LYDSRKAVIDHTHAFDDYSSPFYSGTANPEAAGRKILEKLTPLERPAVYALVATIILGAALRRIDRDGRLERWLTASPQATTAGRPKWDVQVPGFVLGLLSLLGLVAFSVVGAFIYYPDRQQCLDDMASVHAEAFVAINTGSAEEAIRQLERWELITRKLQVGEYIRRFELTPEQAQTPDALREAMEEVRDQLLAGQLAEAKVGLRTIEKHYKACKEAYPRP
jgi:uncharacterized protein